MTYTYHSKFKLGDNVWVIYKPNNFWQVGNEVENWRYDMLIYENDIFPTRKEAEIECKKRNSVHAKNNNQVIDDELENYLYGETCMNLYAITFMENGPFDKMEFYDKISVSAPTIGEAISKAIIYEVENYEGPNEFSAIITSVEFISKIDV